MLVSYRTTRTANVPYIPWEWVADLIQYDEELGPTINVIGMLLPPSFLFLTYNSSYNLVETKTGLESPLRPTGGPPLAERCKELFAALGNQLLSACCPNSPTQAPSPMSEDIYDTHRGSAETVSMQSVVVKPFSVMRRRLNRDGYIKIIDDG